MVAAKGHVAHGHIEEVLGIIDALVTLNGNAGVLIELLGNAPGEAVQLHAVQFAVAHGLRQTAEEIAHAAGRLQDVAGLEAHVGEGIIDGPDDNRGGVMGIEGGRPSRRILVLGQQGLELPVLAVALVKAVRKPAPAHVLGQNLLLLRSGEAVLRLQLFQQPDGLDVAVELLAGSACAQGIIMDAVVVALLRGDFRVQNGGRYFAAVAAYRRGRGKLDGGGLFRFRGGLRFRLLRGAGLLCGLRRVSIGGEEMAVHRVFGQLHLELRTGHDLMEQRAVRVIQGHILVTVSQQLIFLRADVDRRPQGDMVRGLRCG